MQASLTAAALAAMLMASTAAHADAPSALQSFYANMGRIGMSIGLTQPNARAEATPVRGMYALVTSSGKLAGYFNEAGTLYGDGTGMQVLPAARGQNLRKFTPEEVLSFRAEVMNAIDYDQLLKVNYGAGNNRKQLMFSAVDCGYCQTFEKEMAKHADKLNTTIYVMPLSLRDLNQGRAQWQAVSAISCAPDRGEAWKTFWQTQKAPTAQCAINPKIAETRYTYLKDIFRAAGITVKGTPTFVREDGTVVASTEIRYLGKTFGSSGAVATPADPQQWLVAGAPQPADATATAEQQQQPGPKKIKLNDALKSLFN